MKQIEFENIDEIKVKASKKVLRACQNFITLLGNTLGISAGDILSTMGLGTGKYPKDLEIKAFEYLQLEALQDKEIFLKQNNLTENLVIEIVEHTKKISEVFSDLPSTLLRVLLDESKSDTLFNEFLDIILLSTEDHETNEPITKEVLQNTDVRVLIELFSRIFILPKNRLEKALFLNSTIMKIKLALESSNFIKNVKSLI